MRLLALALATGTLLSGCGDPASPDDDDTPPPDAAPEPTGDFTHPEDFPRDGCSPGGFAAGPEGIYHLRLDYGDGFERAMAIRVDDLGGTLGGLIAGHEVDVAYQYGDDDVVLQWQDGGELRAVDLCARDGDTVVGTYAGCTDGQDPPCSTMAIDGKLLHRLDEAEAEGMTLLGEFGAGWPVDFFQTGVSVNVRVKDGLAYVARYEDGLRIVDVHDPSAMVELGHLMPESADAGEIYNDVKVIDGYALMASDWHGVVVVDVSDPTAPAIVGHIGGEVNTHTLFVDGGRAYLASYGPGLDIYDIADPLAPVHLGSFDLTPGSYLHDLYVSGDRAYLNFWNEGMAIVDVSDPAVPALLGVFADYGEHSSHSNWVTRVGDRDIAIHGDEQWGAHVHIVDVTEGTPAFATGIGEWQTRPEVSVHNIMALGELAVMAHYQDGIRVLDLADPTAPVEVAHFDTWPGYDRDYGKIFFEGAIGVDLDAASRTVYVADSHRGLLVLHLD